MRWIGMALGLLCGLGLPACYASHGTSDGAACDLDALREWPCEGEPPRFATTIPNAVCALDDGTLIAISDTARPIYCSRIAEGRYGVVQPSCIDGAPGARPLADCGALDTPEATFVISDRPPSLRHTFTVPPGRCEVYERAIATEPFTPRDDPAELCSDPLAWCGSPVLFTIRLVESDPCGGAQYIERCDAEITTAGIVVRISSAEARLPTGCELTLGPRFATCAVPPLSAGSHRVLDRDGRTLGTLEIPAAPNPVDTEATCTPIP